MGYVFEELIRKFNEDNNEEAGEHFTPREVIDLMTHIVFEPIKDKLPSVMTIYDQINDETYAICKSDMMPIVDPTRIIAQQI